MIVRSSKSLLTVSAYPNESQIIRAPQACVATIPRVSIIGQSKAIAKAPKTDLRALEI